MANADEKIIEKLFKIVEFYKYCVYNNVKLLLLERDSEVSPLERESVLFVDENFDEFFIQ